MCVSTSLNTEDFVNRVDQAHRLRRTTRPRRRVWTASAKQIALYSHTTLEKITLLII